MKKIIFALLAISALGTSCKKDNTGSGQNSPSTSIDSVRPNGTNLDLYWKTMRESGIVSYTLQKSTDSVNFSNTLNVTPVSNDGSDVSYTTSVAIPSFGVTMFYRVTDSLSNGQIIFSNIVKYTGDCNLTTASLTGSSYRVTKLLYQSSATAPEDDLTSSIDPCMLDNPFNFTTGGIYNVPEVGILCNPPEDYSGTWFLSGNTFNMDGDDYTVVIFTCTIMKIKSIIDPVTGESFSIQMVRQ